LLGADLEHRNRAGQGWLAVLDAHQDPIAASVFKVPHHGAKSSDHPDVWDRMLLANPIALVTPFSGGRPLPSPNDQQRIAGRTTNAYCTAKHSAAPKREPMIEKKIRDQVKSRRVTTGPPGHLRVRWRVGDAAAEPSVEMFNGAFRLGAV
jgi:hypothetical protein